MAQTKTKQPKPKAKSKGKQARPKSTRKSAAKPTATSKPKPSSGGSSNGAAKVASKAKVPLLAAGGAALVGAASGIAFGASRSGSKVMGVKLPAPKRVKLRSKDLASAAKSVGHFGDQVGELTSELRSFREGAANGSANSPIEVLLRGLTHRR